MAIVRMKPFFLIGVLKNRKKILETLQKLECVQVEPVTDLKKINQHQTISQIDSMINNADHAIEIIEKYSNKKDGFLKSPNFKLPEKLNVDIAKSDNLYKKVKSILNSMSKIEKIQNKINKLENESLALFYYLSLDLPTDVQNTKYTNVLIGSIPGFWDNESLLNKLGTNIYFEIIDANKLQTSVFFIIPKDINDKVRKILLDIGFSQPPFSSTRKTPNEKLIANKEKINKLKEEILKYENKIKSICCEYKNIQDFADCLRLRKEKYETICKIGLTDTTFVLKGFVNPKFESKIMEKIERQIGAYIEISQPNESSPVDFSNNFFVSPVEDVTQTYSMPSYDDIDPNPIMSFFYYIFFGMMFSDAGYGLVLSIVCGYLAFFKKFEASKKAMFRMFFFCGISTTFWGFMYGSFFGDAIDTVAKVFFNSNLSLSPLWINTVTEPLTLFIFSIVVGLIQIIIGLSIKFYTLFRRRKFMEAIATVLDWIFILLGIGIFGTGKATNNDIVCTIGLILAILGTCLVILLGGYKNKGPMKILGGIISLYDITSYISDALSYSRLMALGIATGVIANVVNILGSMAGNGILGFILFIVISILGHAMNFGINILGAYVHTNRLQYVEFFSKFYEGGGKKFIPFGMHTKYIKFLNKIK